MMMMVMRMMVARWRSCSKHVSALSVDICVGASSLVCTNNVTSLCISMSFHLTYLLARWHHSLLVSLLGEGSGFDSMLYTTLSSRSHNYTHTHTCRCYELWSWEGIRGPSVVNRCVLCVCTCVMRWLACLLSRLPFRTRQWQSIYLNNNNNNISRQGLIGAELSSTRILY